MSQQPLEWTDPLAEPLVYLLREYGVQAEPLDLYTTRLLAVPVSAQFSKPRTNLILRRLTPAGCSSVYIDSDLDYRGPDQALASAWTGPCRDSWRRLHLPPVPGTVNEALCKVLELLDSPLAQRARAVVGPPSSPVTESRPPLGRLLASAGRLLPPDEAASAYESCFRKEQAQRLAILLTRPAPPRCALLAGRPGSGRHHLMHAAAHMLLEAGEIEQVFRVSAARVVAGCVFPAEVDQALVRFLDEALEQPGCLLLIRDLDLCLLGSPAGMPLLCEAIDRGLRLLATVRSEASADWLRCDESLARRIAVEPVGPPDAAEVAGALHRLAESSAVAVAPSAVQTALRLAPQSGIREPAASLGLLGAALAEAAWHGHDQVGPDDIFAVHPHVYPEVSEKE